VFRFLQDPYLNSRILRINDYTYNEERMLSIEGDTGPYLQYAHARLTSLKAKNINLHRSQPEEIKCDSLAPMPHAREIAFLLGKYPDVVRTAMKTHEPSGVVTYAFQLSHAISSAWETVIVKGEEDEEKASARLFLYERARDVLGGAMRLLSIRPLERM
jgi:arginyl-tRNA synthetase